MLYDRLEDTISKLMHQILFIVDELNNWIAVDIYKKAGEATPNTR